MGMTSKPVGVVYREVDVIRVLDCSAAVVELVASVIPVLVLVEICPDCDSRERVFVVKVVDTATDEVSVASGVELVDSTTDELTVTTIWLVTVVCGGMMVTVTSFEPLLFWEVTVLLSDAAALDDATVLVKVLEEPAVVVAVVPRIPAATAGS